MMSGENAERLTFNRNDSIELELPTSSRHRMVCVGAQACCALVLIRTKGAASLRPYNSTASFRFNVERWRAGAAHGIPIW